MSTNLRRPTGVTWVALALVWFFVTGIGNLFVWRSIPPGVFPPGSPLATFVAALNGPLFTSFFGFYGVTALVAAVAAWRMHRWMPRAFLVWSVAAVSLGAFFLLEVPAEFMLGSKTAAVALALGLAGMSAFGLWLIYRYLQRVAVGSASAAL
jgi:hypothetical protein